MMTDRARLPSSAAAAMAALLLAGAAHGHGRDAAGGPRGVPSGFAGLLEVIAGARAAEKQPIHEIPVQLLIMRITRV